MSKGKDILKCPKGCEGKRKQIICEYPIWECPKCGLREFKD